jgi:uncharacterized protein (DUF1778 family)
MPRIEISLPQDQIAILVNAAKFAGKSVEDLLLDCAKNIIRQENDRANMAETMPGMYAIWLDMQK